MANSVLEEVNGDKSKPSFISFMDALHLKARDHGRTPVQVDSTSPTPRHG